ncbi:calcium-binding protein [Rhodococcus fascians]|uniref:PASTA domain-containing protein n=1 Tax=Rhodococcoides fascians TaxID=1828 RepID=UPI00195F29AF|nr:PASTA domain-containing protein [Rhodococcus fascians]MBM7245263.1 calcium-binding protein [Rhodococcus fascians]MBY3810988.1 calcium-binding protein [Rhodococcus fascians]MBY3842491.1 calcium-binding protein [Rhodococcus fascians]MBY3845400.1 calcium-binding protein [Rhodococcus fascians]MBY3851868.1 calcium-binding protein [Rhodococcus fascians]
MNLQSAQNAIQAAGVFCSRSADASGEGRMQVNDSNWIVVEQDPAPGALIGEGEAVLSAVKIGEPNNC